MVLRPPSPFSAMDSRRSATLLFGVLAIGIRVALKMSERSKAMKTKTNLKAGSGGDRPTESVSLSFGKLAY